MLATIVTEAFEAHRRLLWSLAYRMTGCAADAEDLVQETYLRAVEHPPKDGLAPLKSWLVAVTVNLAKDFLRRRRTRAYPGIWLPGPASLEPEALAVDPPQAGFDLLESGSYAFLVALETLTPQQRAVLLLREVFELSGQETANALGLSETNVKVTLHRAKKILIRPSYPSNAQRELAQRALTAFQEALAKQDLAALEALFVPEVRACGDGGGVYTSGKSPIVGSAAVARFFIGLMKAGSLPTTELRLLNGMPALVGAWKPSNPRVAPRWMLQVDVNSTGGIQWLRVVSAPRKLTTIFE